MAVTRTLSALADPTRREIFEQLRRGPSSVNDLAAGLPVSRPAVSQHLKVLREAGLVRKRREGRQRIYTVELEGLRELRQYLDQFWTDVLAAFKESADASDDNRPKGPEGKQR